MKKEQITHNKLTLGIIIYRDDTNDKIKFYTEDESSLQVGKHSRERGEKIKPHMHVPVKIERNEDLKEVLYIESGKMKVNFYTEDGANVASRIVNPGDMVLLISGGHGFEFIEETRMIEVKQGPYDPACRKPLEIREEVS